MRFIVKLDKRGKTASKSSKEGARVPPRYQTPLLHPKAPSKNLAGNWRLFVVLFSDDLAFIDRQYFYPLSGRSTSSYVTPSTYVGEFLLLSEASAKVTHLFNLRLRPPTGFSGATPQLKSESSPVRGLLPRKRGSSETCYVASTRTVHSCCLTHSLSELRKLHTCFVLLILPTD